VLCCRIKSWSVDSKFFIWIFGSSFFGVEVEAEAEEDEENADVFFELLLLGFFSKNSSELSELYESLSDKSDGSESSKL